MQQAEYRVLSPLVGERQREGRNRASNDVARFFTLTLILSHRGRGNSYGKVSAETTI